MRISDWSSDVCSSDLPHTGFLDSEAQPFGCSVRSARGTRLALLPPSFLSSSPATVRSARTDAVKEASAGLVRPAAQRGHGPARLDGTRARATVAVKVRSEEHTSELQSLMRLSYAVFCLKKKNTAKRKAHHTTTTQ